LAKSSASNARSPAASAASLGVPVPRANLAVAGSGGGGAGGGACGSGSGGGATGGAKGTAGRAVDGATAFADTDGGAAGAFGSCRSPQDEVATTTKAVAATHPVLVRKARSFEARHANHHVPRGAAMITLDRTDGPSRGAPRPTLCSTARYARDRRSG
jgi:hypothetical protein